MHAAVIQMVSGVELDANLQQAERLLVEAADAGVQLALLPENFALFETAGLRGLAEQEAQTHRLHHWLSTTAERLGLWLVAGSVPALQRPDGSAVENGRVRSRCLVYDDQGQLRASYDKRHLFDVDVGDAQSSYRESASIEPGDNPVVVGSPLGVLGLSICYDLRFPGHYHRLRDLGAELLLVPSAFTRVTGEAHWEVLLRARAIETQCYVLGADQGGDHSATRQTYGGSMIVDPWGRVVARCGLGEQVVSAEIDRYLLAQVRRDMPVWSHRRD